jgi:hypothetical protein
LMTENKELPQIPIDAKTYSASSLKAITREQLWLGALLIELRNLNAQIAELIALQTRGEP